MNAAAQKADRLFDTSVIDKVNGLSQADLGRFDAWQEFADLSSNTLLEALDADPASIVWSGEEFSLLASAYLNLSFGSGEDEESFGDEYPVSIRGVIEDGQPSITSIEPDVSSFYE